MKKIAVYIKCLVIVTIFISCKKSFLEVSPTGDTKLELNYYKTAQEVFNGLVSVYDPLGSQTGSTYSSKLGLLNVASDDCGVGGGSASDQAVWTAWDNFTVNAGLGPQGDLWGRNYTGIYRANLLIVKLEEGAPVSNELKGRYISEAKFLRAYYYFDLVRLFKNVPLITASLPAADIRNIPQAKPEDVYIQIEKDLNDAIGDANLPNTVPVSTQGGRVTKAAAKALLGKVLLYQGKWGPAAAQFADVNGTPGGTSMFGNKLLANYADIFRQDNKFNTESIFEIVHTAQAKQDWGGWGSFEGNVMVQMVGPRNYNGPIYAVGWGFCPITQSLITAIKPDPRYPATLANIDSIVAADPSRSYEAGYQNTGYFIEKYAPKVVNRSTMGGDPVLNYASDYIEIRLADTYLMEAEALIQGGGDIARAKALMDAVRARVGLGSVPATLANVYQERRMELATEGHRFFDLVRTGQAATVLGPYGFTANKNEILPIPLSDLNGTKLEQNPHY